MSQATTPTVSVDLIDVTEGFNPRRSFDEEKLDELAASIASAGVVQPIRVTPGEGDRYVLVAGERRLRAARKAGVTEVPISIGSAEDALAEAIAENLHDEGLNPVEWGFVLKRFADQSGLKQSELADAVGKSKSWVSERLRLIRLPEGCRDLIGAGELSLDVEKPLREIAGVSVAVAEAVAKHAAEQGNAHQLVSSPGEAVWRLSHSGADGLVLIDLSRGTVGFDVVADSEREGLLERYVEALNTLGYATSAEYVDHVEIDEAAIDAARASGQLLEFTEGDYRSYEFLCDAVLAADMVLRAVEAQEAEARREVERLEAEAKAATERGEEPPEVPEPRSASEREEDAKAERRKQRQAAEKAKSKAEDRNQKLGADLLNRRGAQTRKEHSLERAKILARLVMSQNGDLAAAGLRYVMPALSYVEETELKSGARRSKVVYRDRGECADYLAEKVEDAKSAQEVLELLTDSIIAALWADEGALAMSNRIHWNCPTPTIATALKDEAKAVGTRGKPRSNHYIGY